MKINETFFSILKHPTPAPISYVLNCGHVQFPDIIIKTKKTISYQELANWNHISIGEDLWPHIGVSVEGAKKSLRSKNQNLIMTFELGILIGETVV